MIVIQTKREGNFINLASLLMAPYIAFVFINNFFFYKRGFYKISDAVLLMILSAFVCFFISGLMIFPGEFPKIYEEDNEERYKLYNMDAMINVALFIGIISSIKSIYMYATGGFSGNNFDLAEGVMGNGIVGHLLLVSYSILPIIFLYWTDHKKKISALLAIVLIAIPTFLTFVKYNIIGLIVSLFIFLVLYKKSALKKATVALLVLTVVVFVANYAIGFFTRNVVVNNNFYIDHFWVYCAGSLINDNHIFTIGLNTEQSILYKLCIFLFAFPNMFIKKFNDGVGVFQHIKKPFLPIGSQYGQRSNVVDAIGYLFPSKGTIADVILFLIIMSFIGVIFTRIYIKHKKSVGYFNTYLCNFLTYFVFFSFFGTFYINPAPWEITLYSLIIPHLFLKDSKLTQGIIRIG